MKNMWFYLPKVLGAILLLAALTMIGAGGKAPLLFAVFFLVVFAALFLLNKSTKTKTHESGSGTMLSKVFQFVSLIVFLAFLSLMGAGNRQNVPFFALFFIAVFAAVYLLNKRSSQSAREEKTSSFWMYITQIVGLILFMAVLASLGLIHGIVGYLVWLLAIAAIFLLIYLIVKNRKKPGLATEGSPLLKKLLGIVLAILAILLPFLMVKGGGVVGLPAGNQAMDWVLIILAIIVFAGLTVLANTLVNRKNSTGSNQVLGYVLMVIAALIPGVLIMIADKNSNGYAQGYFAALVAMVLAYFSRSLIVPKS